MHSFTHQHMATLLNIQGLLIYKIEEKKNCFEVKIGQAHKQKGCPHCTGNRYKKNGKGKLRKLRHGSLITGKPLFLLWQSHMYMCLMCKKSWTRKPPDWLVEGRRRSTKDCNKQGLRILKETSFAGTQRQTGLGYNVLRRTLEEHIQTNSLLQLPEIGEISLGVDEHSRQKRRYATTITLLKPETRLIGILPKKSNKSLEKWVNEYWTKEQRFRVTEICVDMAKCWKYGLPSLFPNAKTVIDHFHVIAYLNNLIVAEYRISVQTLNQEKRKLLPLRTKGHGVLRKLYGSGVYWNDQEKEKIRAVFELMPKVAELWYWKEEVRRIYWECNFQEEARSRWQVVLSHLKFHDIVAAQTLTEHLENILNYFDKRTTNAFTEGIHTKFKLIKRYSYGIKNPDIYVKKLLLGFTSHKDLIRSHAY